MQTWTYSLISVIAISLISFVGILTLSLSRKKLEKILLFLVSFAIGALFGDAIIHLIPEALEKIENHLTASLYIILGIIAFFVLEKIIRWNHCHSLKAKHKLHPVVALNFLGDGIHNFIDGLLIGASYMVSVPIGIATTIAVILHEIPQEIGDFGILVHGGLSTKKALLFNFISALFAVVGAVMSLILGQFIQGYTPLLLALTAGGFIYIAGSDLIPELQHRCDLKRSTAFGQLIMIILGIAVIASLAFFE